jgi:hypothetical protein
MLIAGGDGSTENLVEIGEVIPLPRLDNDGGECPVQIARPQRGVAVSLRAYALFLRGSMCYSHEVMITCSGRHRGGVGSIVSSAWLHDHSLACPGSLQGASPLRARLSYSVPFL